ncbi:MAG TPA: DegV family protein [Acidimicrobiales bacterium]|nr:DegV family protein [Acidimicrobiales bacterium]
MSGGADTLLAVDGAVDLPDELDSSATIRVIHGTVWLGNEPFVGDRSEFWARLRSGADFSTAPPTVESLSDTYCCAEVVCALHVSAELSATVSHARSASEAVSSRVSVVDSRSLSVGAGLVAAMVHDAMETSTPEAAVADHARSLCERLHTFAVIQDVRSLERSGRAGLLPAHHLSSRRPLVLGLRGRALALDQPRDRAASVRRLAGRAREASAGSITAWALGHGDASDRDEVCETIAKSLGMPPRYVAVIDPFVGAHVGPDAVIIGVMS